MNKRKKRTDVGYGRPPADKQFKPGASGNPRGRPKGAKGSFQMLFQRELDQKRRVRLGEETVEITGRELAVKRLMQKVLEGSRTHFDIFMRLEEKWQAEKPEPPAVKNDGMVAGVVDFRMITYLPPALFAPFLATLEMCMEIAAAKGFKQLTTEGLEFPRVIHEEMNKGFHRGLQLYEASAAAKQPNAWRFPWDKLKHVRHAGDGKRRKGPPSDS